MDNFVSQVRNFVTSLYERGALAGRTQQQAFFVQARPIADTDGGFRLRFGLAMDKPGEFVEAEIDVESGRGGRIRHSPVIEAEQLFS